MRPTLDIWKLLCAALAAALLTVLLTSHSAPTMADAQNNRYSLVQGIAPLGVGGGPVQPTPDMFRIDNSTGETAILLRGSNTAYQWQKIPEPAK